LDNAIVQHLQAVRACVVAWERTGAAVTGEDYTAAMDEAGARAAHEVQSGIVMWAAFADLATAGPSTEGGAA
jgi:hypothetical protein